MNSKLTGGWLPVVAVFLVGCCATAVVPQTVPILGRIAAEFRVNRFELGWVISLPSLACAVGALLFGIVVDRLGDRAMIYAGVAIVVIGDVAATQAVSLNWLLVARILQGIGYVALSVAGATFVLRTTTGERRKSAMALWAAHTPAGFAGAIWLVTPLAQSDVSWHWAFYGHALLVGALGVFAWTVIRHFQGGALRRSAGTGLVLTTPGAYRVGIASLGSALLQTGFMTTLPTHLAQQYGTSPADAAIYILMAMAANLAGALIVVLTAIGRTPTRWLLTSAAVAAATGSAVNLALSDSVTVAVATTVIFAGFLGTANALIWSLLPSIVTKPEASGAFGGFVTQTTFIGVLLGPPVFFGLLHADRTDYSVGTVLLLFAFMIAAAPGLFKSKSAAVRA